METYFVIIVTYIAPIEMIDHYLEQHKKFLDRYYDEGIFLVSGPQVPRTGGVILARNVTREELEEICQKDPFSLHKVATYQIYAFSARKKSPHFMG